jgi:hypothetical protein
MMWYCYFFLFLHVTVPLGSVCGNPVGNHWVRQIPSDCCRIYIISHPQCWSGARLLNIPLSHSTSKTSPYNRPLRAHRGSGSIALLILDLGARRGWVFSTTPWPPYPQERPANHSTGCWVGPRASLDMCKSYRPHRDSISGPSSP